MPASTRSFLFPDVNVWVALTYQGHVHHSAAKGWFVSLHADARLFFCRVTHLGLLRLLTTEAVMGDEVMSQTSAWEAYDRRLEDSRVAFLAEPPAVEQAFRAMSHLGRPAAKDWADSYLAAFATVSDLTVVTFDRGLHGKARQAIFLK